ncbi:hypothetical protein SAMN02799630_01783 [Paenibacillus sp. UNCCL117]|uniref:CBO0543 family protein n=1 Tax=unclassified Paenibacillus TaxID=185978 RepID=UPI000883E79F|nr:MULTISPECIES: CBO0543 family protein [unclassified Paenibacillus]SDC93739.1 hypothetical protein SAMN04488602_104271 [Paenibacillus sp. cl123]SFW29628.1 hypothetical protein SAMN02799630_01783 [Paenibacillus sp. UNCCL117]
MIVNLIIGFLVPWIVGLFLYRKSPAMVWLICPFAATISALINDIGYHLNVWDFTPEIENDETLSALPFDLGFYPVMAYCLILWIRKNNRHVSMKIGGISLLTTALEYICFLAGKLEYGNGWNLGWTFLSYIFAYGLVYLYYLRLVKFDVIRIAGDH